MISNSEIKLITSLQKKKYRDQHGLFVAEGFKLIDDLINSGVELHSLWTDGNDPLTSLEFKKISAKEFKKISLLKNPNGHLGVFKKLSLATFKPSGLILALDAVRDPGNLGTIIRLCDWFGIDHLICSQDTVDCYNPKVVQASMGSVARVNIHYLDLPQFLEPLSLPVYGAFMDGESAYLQQYQEDAILVMGNEGNGISSEIEGQITQRLSIPNFSKNNAAESLNVAMAAGILISEIRRSTGK